MPPIRILVVDDHALSRELLIDILSRDNEIEIAGEAGNGKEALEMVLETKPDLVTMDLEMPLMDGMEAIKRIMAINPVPILVVTAFGSHDTAFRAISHGALEVVEKPDFNLQNRGELIKKIKLLSKVKVITHLQGKRTKRETLEKPSERGEGFDRVVVIACSTGGPKALSTILPELPEDFPCPVFVAQHILDGFLPGLVKWLDSISKLKVKAGVNRQEIVAGTVYISPPDKNMEIDAENRVGLVNKQPNDIYHPSCDFLLSSVAKKFGSNSIGVILTGMGEDGVTGMKKIKAAGGATIAQDESTAIVYGMPKVAIESGCIDKVLPLNEIADEVFRMVNFRY